MKHKISNKPVRIRETKAKGGAAVQGRGALAKVVLIPLCRAFR